METAASVKGFETYEAYQDSGEPWIGDIPEHWEVRKLKHLFAEKKHTPNPEMGSGSISFGRVVEKADEKIPAATKASYQEVLAGEFLINPLNLNYDLISLRIALSEIDVVVSPGYIVIKNLAELDKNYFKYLLHRYDVAYMKLLGSGVRQTISFNHIANSPLAFPPPAEQTAIAEFLDRKTALVEKAIAQKEALILRLGERRQILIHRAVTRGLNPNAEMKDSGVEWIGEVPAHWEVKRLKHLTVKIGSGVTPTGGGTTYKSEGIPFIRSQNVYFEGLLLEDIAFIDEKTHAGMSNSHVKRGDVLLNITGGSIGRCFYVETDLPMNVNQHVCIVRPSSKIETIYLNGLLASELGQGQIWYNQQGGGREGLNFQALKNFFFPLPPVEEQQLVSAYILKTTEKFAAAIALKRQEIEKLREYKTVLINAAVTGKIKVV